MTDLNNGTGASSSTFWRGDGILGATPSGGGGGGGSLSKFRRSIPVQPGAEFCHQYCRWHDEFWVALSFSRRGNRQCSLSPAIPFPPATAQAAAGGRACQTIPCSRAIYTASGLPRDKYNTAGGGDTAQGILADYSAAIHIYAPGAGTNAFAKPLMAGINDVGTNGTAEEVYSSLTNIWTQGPCGQFYRCGPSLSPRS